MENIQTTLQVFVIKQGDNYIAYAPALEISAYGSTIEDAQKDFREVLALFFEEINETGCLSDFLLDMGWKLQKKPVAKYIPPLFNRKTSIKQFPAPSQLIKTERQNITFPV